MSVQIPSKPGVTTTAPVGSSPNSAAALISGQVITLEPADATHPGVVTTGAQTIAGVKTFSDGIIADVSSSTATATNGITSRTLASHFGDWLNVKDFGAIGNASADDTNAIKAAIATGRPLYFPAGGYVISDSLLLSNVTRVFWTGEGSSSYIINNAPANKASIVLSSVRDFIIEKLAIIGQTGFPNHAIKINQLPATTETSDGILRDLNLQPNGYGFVIDKSDLVTVQGCKYWSCNNGLPSSVDAGQRKYAVLVDIATSGQFFNGYAFRDCNFQGIDSTISGSSCFKLGATLGNIDSLIIDNCELEGTSLTALDISGAYNLSLKNTFVENATLLIDNSRNCTIESCFNPTLVQLTGCVQVVIKSATVDNGTYSIDNTSFACGSYDSSVGTLSDSGTNSTHLNLRLSGVLQNDLVYGLKVSTLTVSQLVATDSSKNLVSQATGNLTDVGTDGIVISNGSGAVIGSGTSLAQHVSDTTHNGYLSSTDWNTFNGKQPAGSYVAGASNLTTPGSVPYVSASGVVNQDSADLFLDITNHRLGVKNSSPSYTLDVGGDINLPDNSAVRSSGNGLLSLN